MTKEIKIKIIDADKYKFALDEDAKKDDYFSLQNISKIDLSYIIKEIDEKRNQIIEQKFLKRIEQEKINIINEFKTSEEYKKLEIENRNLTEKLIKSESNNENAINNYKNSSEYKDLIKEKDTLTHKISELKIQLEKDQKIKILETENKLKEEFSNKEKQMQKEINELKQKNDELLRQRKNTNVKILGEAFEQWIQNEYNNAFGTIEDCELTKTTKTVNDTKPDFLFEIFTKINQKKYTLGSVVIEAKTQADDKTLQKNWKFFDKLNQDRLNRNSDFALLVTDLEPNEEFLIKKIHEYDNMYICRPIAMITFLSMIRLIYKKREEEITKNKNNDIEFKEKQEIANEFDQMKNDIIDKTIKNINENISKVITKSENIEKFAKEIQEIAKNKLNKQISTVENKINNFKITKIIKKID